MAEKPWSKYPIGTTVRIRHGERDEDDGLAAAEGGGKVGDVAGYSVKQVPGTLFIRCDDAIHEVHESWVDPVLPEPPPPPTWDYLTVRIMLLDENNNDLTDDAVSIQFDEGYSVNEWQLDNLLRKLTETTRECLRDLYRCGGKVD